MNVEKQRLQESAAKTAPWQKWGPYLCERQWGTVREDYSPNGSAWDYLPHDQACRKAYRWGEDGIAGLCDDGQRLCLAPAFWNGKDPILKERFFGLTNPQGNHGEDVKELYYYLDATPTHSYLKMLYKYPQTEFPYGRLVEENRCGKDQPEFELLDTGVFDEDRYFDVFVEYAKVSAEDVLMLITAHNRGPDVAVLHVVPQIWFRNTWSWEKGSPRPALMLEPDGSVSARHPQLGEYRIYAQGNPSWLFCDNETNAPRLYGGTLAGYFKDAVQECIVQGNGKAVNPEKTGTKAGAHFEFTVPSGRAATVRVRLSASRAERPFEKFDELFNRRRAEADDFYAELQTEISDADSRNVQRQAFAGMVWNKQCYQWDIPQWLDGDPAQPPPPASRRTGRNSGWRHLNNAEVLSVPDKWEFPWYAAWDLAFHCIPLALIDPEFAKSQLVLLTREWYMHPNGQLPAYEWALDAVNPPVHAWAAWRVFQIDRKQSGGKGDLAFLERVFHKLLLNFTWWVNCRDADGRNIFQGGFLGLDNIGVFNRGEALPDGASSDQADATSWMAMYCLNMMRISLELALHNPVYQDVATKFLEHFLEVALAMTNMAECGHGLWDEQDSFYYDVLKTPGHQVVPLRVRSIVGLIPLFAVETLDPEMLEKLPDFSRRLKWFLDYRPDMAGLVSRWTEPGSGERKLLSLLRGHRMKCLLQRMLDDAEFLSDFGIRSLSRFHLKNPYKLTYHGRTLQVSYEPGESQSVLLGGNSNWRGPVWFPVNFLLIESLQKFHHYYGDDFKIECPTRSGRLITLSEVANELTNRLSRIFLRGEDGRRPVYGASEKMQNDPHFRDYILFHEYFHGDSGLGLGASHQTGWTGLVAKCIQSRRNLK